MTTKTTQTISSDIVKACYGILSLMKPNSKAEVDTTVIMASRVVESMINEHVSELVEAGFHQASEALKNK